METIQNQIIIAEFVCTTFSLTQNAPRYVYPYAKSWLDLEYPKAAMLPCLLLPIPSGLLHSTILQIFSILQLGSLQQTPLHSERNFSWNERPRSIPTSSPGSAKHRYPPMPSDTEKEIIEWNEEILKHGDLLIDLQQGTAFKAFGDDSPPDTLDLALSLFIDCLCFFLLEPPPAQSQQNLKHLCCWHHTWSFLTCCHSYWNPTQHVVLGAMHNWLEGILQSHFRYHWCFKSLPKYAIAKRRGPQLSTQPHGGFFSQMDIEAFRRGLQQVVLREGLAKLPSNLGEEQHGRLTASQWYTLFAYVVPLVIFDMFIENVGRIELESNRAKFLSSNKSLRFETNYAKYSLGAKELFPKSKIQPNHHFALQVPDQIRTWGPIISLAKFSGERLIGFLQKINTNNKISEVMMACGLIIVSKVYNCLYNWLQKRLGNIVHQDTISVPRGAHVLLGYAQPVKVVTCGECRVSIMKPNNCLVARISGRTRYGLHINQPTS
ncbi:hypothetical protein VP01_135g7 [Puccinia sorghi]|uniref:Uncharacterized protein n=1 Tax=Puccinia sorghi TaxID=27349 RepID=A0A0L6VLX5_9BASI|nr:hypothetical protein VP01_135g7 [Puccinia sorghi]